MFNDPVNSKSDDKIIEPNQICPADHNRYFDSIHHHCCELSVCWLSITIDKPEQGQHEKNY